jgi:hypothetical protein
VALVRTDVSEERIAPIIRLRRIGELGTTLAVTGSRSTPASETSDLKRAKLRNSPEDGIHTKTKIPFKKLNF